MWLSGKATDVVLQPLRLVRPGQSFLNCVFSALYSDRESLHTGLSQRKLERKLVRVQHPLGKPSRASSLDLYGADPIYSAILAAARSNGTSLQTFRSTIGWSWVRIPPARPFHRAVAQWQSALFFTALSTCALRPGWRSLPLLLLVLQLHGRIRSHICREP